MTDERRRELVELILNTLNRYEVRATYAAVGKIIGVFWRNVHLYLPEDPNVPGKRRPRLSWVVNGDTELPSGYTEEQMHPRLQSTPYVIKNADELRRICGIRTG